MIEDTDLRALLHSTAERASLPATMLPALHKKVRGRRARTIGAAILAVAALGFGGVQGMEAIATYGAAPDESAGKPDTSDDAPPVDSLDLSTGDVRPAAEAPGAPYLIDLDSKEMTRLPQAILGALHPSGRYDRFAVSWDGEMLAFVGTGDDGSPQIFVSDLEGNGLRQLTRDEPRATSPAWSPDGELIAYESHGDEGRVSIAVVDVATGETRPVTNDRACCAAAPAFTPDGQYILYTGGDGNIPNSRKVPVRGGETSVFVELDDGLEDAGQVAISPDGRLVTYLGGGFPFPEMPDVHCGPCRIVANVDGSERRAIPGWMGSSSGAWSPDGTRVVSGELDGMAGPDRPTIIVVYDVTTGEGLTVADGRWAIWVDVDTLLVDV